jgi:hypothetical protein
MERLELNFEGWLEGHGKEEVKGLGVHEAGFGKCLVVLWTWNRKGKMKAGRD